MAELLVDTDVLVDHLRGARRLQATGDRLHCSTITRAELFAGRPSEHPAVAELLDPFDEHPVDRRTAEIGGGIRSQTGLRLPDALIAATAIANGLELLTRNARDFERVAGLPVRPPS